MVRVVFYTRNGCHLCEIAEAELRRLGSARHFELEIRDVDSDPEWRDTYGAYVPVILLPNGDELHYRVDAERVDAAIGTRS